MPNFERFLRTYGSWVRRHRNSDPSTRHSGRNGGNGGGSRHWLKGRRAAKPLHGQERGWPGATSFDHLDRRGEERQRDVEAERLGGFEIDDRFEFYELFDRDV